MYRIAEIIENDGEMTVRPLQIAELFALSVKRAC
jgi:hypothetical protein